jgi:hypothetical protein
MRFIVGKWSIEREEREERKRNVIGGILSSLYEEGGFGSEGAERRLDLAKSPVAPRDFGLPPRCTLHQPRVRDFGLPPRCTLAGNFEIVI